VQLCGLTSKLGLITVKTIPDDLEDFHRLHRVSIAHVFLDLDESIVDIQVFELVQNINIFQPMVVQF
jgi:hypothetical protein